MVFISKKKKAEIRARRRKKQKFAKATKKQQRQEEDEKEEIKTTTKEDSDYEKKKETISESTKNEVINAPSPSPSPSPPSTSTITATATPTTGISSKGTRVQKIVVVQPKHLIGKEARKFRKDERRKARVNGLDDTLLQFIMEGETATTEAESKQGMKKRRRNAAESDETNKDDSVKEDEGMIPSKRLKHSTNINNNNNNQHKTKKKALASSSQNSFPRINDLIAEHEASKQAKAEKEILHSKLNAIPQSIRDQYVALDCEMVGIGSGGKTSVLARASLVSWDGTILLDTHVHVPGRITDFRTHVSGIRSTDIRYDNAMDPKTCREHVVSILQPKTNNQPKILVGHALSNDLDALLIHHPKTHRRDTALYKPLMKSTGRNGGKFRSRKLRDLAKERCQLDIQLEGQPHSSVEDARAAMEVYKSIRHLWEKDIAKDKKKKS